MAAEAFAPEDFAPPEVVVERRADGSLVLRSPRPLGRYPPSLGSWLDRWAEAAPDRPFLLEREAAGGWRRVTYGEAARAADAVTQALIDRGLDDSHPVAVLSGNGIDHALLMLGCFHAGVPIVPVSPAYSLMSADFSKLRYIRDLVQPALVYVAAPERYRLAIDAMSPEGVEVVSSAVPSGGLSATPFAALACTRPTEDVARRKQAVTATHTAKILFTSGSTGLPKAVVNTHGMLTANQQMIAQCWPFLEREPPVLVDWLPWNHTFGGNHNFNMVLRNGGILYIDEGKAAPGAIEATVSNLREVSPTIYFNVPAGFSLLLPYLERDEGLCANVFRRLKVIFYAGAALTQDAWDRLERLALRHVGRRVVMTSAWGSTETSPLATSAHFPIARAGVIGLPAPGVEIKLTPSGAKMELGVRGPGVTPGYYRQPELTAAAFDAEGFYRIGDAARFADPDRPERGLVFDGRTGEDFKLSTGTWVQAGSLRVAALSACAPLLRDAVVCGHDRGEVALLAWLHAEACHRVVPEVPHAGPAALTIDASVMASLREALESHNRANPASSTRIARLLVMTEPPSIDANEITDKGYINQRAVLERRAALVERLFTQPPPPDVIVV